MLYAQEYCEDEGKALAPAFQYVLHALYDKDVLEEEAILRWADEQQHASEAEKQLVRQCEKFLTWLREADEDSDDD